ncbi:hypothetical protein Tco_0988783 [Tanacetum coccineum]|uniref:Uncharacterized protein n=1 Tax=Tanacetum coccineum TaxID=301880 RepID=A0ABQ5ESA8_9ASTR
MLIQRLSPWLTQSSRVPVPLPNDPYIAVRQAQLVDTDTESDPEEAPSEAEELHPLGSRVPLMSEEFEASKPSGTRTVSSHSLVSLDSTTPLSPSHPLTHVSPTPTPTRVLFHRRTACMASSYETSSSSLTLPVRKIYRGTSELILDTNSERDKLGEEDTKEDEEDESSDVHDKRESQDLDNDGHDLGDEDHGLDDGIPIVETATSESLGLGYRALRRPELAVGEDQVHSTFEVVRALVPSPIASLVATPTATISVDEDKFIEIEEFRARAGESHNDFLSFVEASVGIGGMGRQASMQRELQEMRGSVTALEHERSRRG